MRQNIKLSTKLLAITAIICSAIALPAHGQCEITEVLDDNGSAFDGFGGSVAISGNVAIVSSVGDDELGDMAGSVFIFRFDPVKLQWEQETKLFASDGAEGDRFGRSVAIINNIAIIGATGDDDKGLNSGAVYIFRYDGLTWLEDVKLFAADQGASDGFGYSIATNANRLIVGAPGDSDGCLLCGSAYIFRYDTDKLQWIEEGKVTASDATTWVEGYDLFGWSVSISDDVVIVGKPRNTFPFPWGPGAAYIYSYDGNSWGGEVKLQPSNSDIGNMAGWSVAIDGDIAIFSALIGHGAVLGSGTAHVFHYDHDSCTWVEEAMLADLEGNLEDYFGSSVSLSGQTAIIGAQFDGDNGITSGSAFIFNYDIKASNWVQQAKLLASDGVGGDIFGWSTAISSNFAIVGAPGQDDIASGAGAAYFFAGFSDTDCNNNGEADFCDIFDGISNDQNNNSIPDECDADLDGNGSVGTSDLLILLGNWGLCDGCSSDLDGDGSVGTSDLLFLLSNWG